jgi:hypothetical protein
MSRIFDKYLERVSKALIPNKEQFITIPTSRQEPLIRWFSSEGEIDPSTIQFREKMNGNICKKKQHHTRHYDIR